MATRRTGGNEAAFTLYNGATQVLTQHEGLEWSVSTNDVVDDTTPYGYTTKRYERLGAEDPRFQVSHLINVTTGTVLTADRPRLPDGTRLKLTCILTPGVPYCTDYPVIIVNQRISPDRGGRAQRVTYDCLPCPDGPTVVLG